MSQDTRNKLVLLIFVSVMAYAWTNVCLNLHQISNRFFMSKNGCHCGEVTK
jgi:hypothetical protein